MKVPLFLATHPSLEVQMKVSCWLALSVIQTRAQVFGPLPNHTFLYVPLLAQRPWRALLLVVGMLWVSSPVFFCFFSWER